MLSTCYFTSVKYKHNIGNVQLRIYNNINNNDTFKKNT